MTSPLSSPTTPPELSLDYFQHQDPYQDHAGTYWVNHLIEGAVRGNRSEQLENIVLSLIKKIRVEKPGDKIKPEVLTLLRSLQADKGVVFHWDKKRKQTISARDPNHVPLSAEIRETLTQVNQLIADYHRELNTQSKKTSPVIETPKPEVTRARTSHSKPVRITTKKVPLQISRAPQQILADLRRLPTLKTEEFKRLVRSLHRELENPRLQKRIRTQKNKKALFAFFKELDRNSPRYHALKQLVKDALGTKDLDCPQHKPAPIPRLHAKLKYSHTQIPAIVARVPVDYFTDKGIQSIQDGKPYIFWLIEEAIKAKDPYKLKDSVQSFLSHGGNASDKLDGKNSVRSLLGHIIHNNKNPDILAAAKNLKTAINAKKDARATRSSGFSENILYTFDETYTLATHAAEKSLLGSVLDELMSKEDVNPFKEDAAGITAMGIILERCLDPSVRERTKIAELGLIGKMLDHPLFDCAASHKCKDFPDGITFLSHLDATLSDKKLPKLVRTKVRLLKAKAHENKSQKPKKVRPKTWSVIPTNKQVSEIMDLRGEKWAASQRQQQRM